MSRPCSLPTHEPRPIRALRGLVAIDCSAGKNQPVSRLRDLSALRDLRLKRSTARFNRIGDLSTLHGRPLQYLDIGDDQAALDMTPLRGTPLR